MELFNQFTIPPTESQLLLLRYLLVMVYAIHLPFLGLVTGATLLSVGFNQRDRDIPNATFARFAKDLMDMVVSNRAVVIVLGVLPLIALWMIYGEWLAGATPPAFPLFPIGALLVALSFGPITAYRDTLYPEGRNSLVNFLLGNAGLLTLLLGAYCVVAAVTRFHDPERWHLEQNIFRQLLSFNVIWRYAVFLISGVAFTACAVLFFFFSWPNRKPIEDESYGRFVKNFGAGVGLATSLLVPVVLFFWVVTVPMVAHSSGLFLIGVGVAAVLFIAFLLFYFSILSPTPRSAATLFVIFLVVFFLTAMGDQLTLVNATQEHSAALVEEGEEIKARIQLEREAQRAGAMQVDVARGEEVFKTICMTCHRMDERLVGPPLNTVLPKYEGRIADLEAFIQNPVKVNPEYPPMPSPGLPLGDIKSVAAYLLGETPEQAPEGTGEVTPDH